MRWRAIGLMAGVAGSLVLTLPVQAGAVRDAATYGFTYTAMAPTDDGNSGAVNIGFSLDFYGTMYSQLYVNNNGNITFAHGLGTFTASSPLNAYAPILAPFFADVDTTVGNTTAFTQPTGHGTVNGHAALAVLWDHVGYYSKHQDKLNTFQLVIIDRSDVGTGDFDFEFNYDQVQWETGDASSGSAGLGGYPVQAGWASGPNSYYEIAGSGVPGSLLDANVTTGLVHNSQGSAVAGRYVFEVRNGVLPTVPEPASLGLLAAGAVALLGRRGRAGR